MGEKQAQAFGRPVQNDAFPRAVQPCERFRFEFRTQAQSPRHVSRD